jgi:hypothetical protein
MGDVIDILGISIFVSTGKAVLVRKESARG